jgi:hypothetical protein
VEDSLGGLIVGNRFFRIGFLAHNAASTPMPTSVWILCGAIAVAIFVIAVRNYKAPKK